MDGLAILGNSSPGTAYADAQALAAAAPAVSAPANSTALSAAGFASAELQESQPDPSAPPIVGPTSAVAVAPSPTPRAEQAGIASLPIAVKYSPSGVPIQELRAEGFDGSA